MIQPLRSYHRIAMLALAVALPALFVSGLKSRRPVVTPDELPERVSLVFPSGTVVLADSRDLWGNAVDAPDLLVYWTESASGASLRGSAHLLGSLEHGRRGFLRLPPNAGPGRGQLVLYSAAYGRVAAAAPVPKEMR